MRRTASHRHSNPTADREAGFTLTELIAGLLVASMLIVGLADVTRRYALTTVRVKATASDLRTVRLIDGLMATLERADPGSLEIGPDRITANVGSGRVEARLTTNPNAERTLEWSSPTTNRTIAVPDAARFENTSFGAIALFGVPGEPPLAIAMPARTIPFDCQFDAMMRACR